MSAYSTATIHFDDGFSTLHPFLNQTTHIYLFDKPIYMFIFWNCFLPTVQKICCWISYTVKMLWLKVWCLRAAWRTEVGILYYEIYKDACFCYVMCLLQCRQIKKELHNLCNNNFILKWNCVYMKFDQQLHMCIDMFSLYDGMNCYAKFWQVHDQFQWCSQTKFLCVSYVYYNTLK
jgi:hypothetical protein